MFRKTTRPFVLFVILVFAAGLSTLAADKMPLEKAGTIGQPEGKIAFIRDKNIYYMNVDGTNQTLLFEATNADGRRIHVVHNWSWDPARVTLPQTMTDLLTVESATLDALDLGPWDVRVLGE